MYTQNNTSLTVKVALSPGIAKKDAIVLIGNQGALGNPFYFIPGKCRSK
jgi:hypothetical protein